MMKFKFLTVILLVFISSCNIISKDEMLDAAEFNNKLVSYTMPVIDDMNSLFRITKSIFE